jgi:antitoxin component YwqK of YwqJK toxin-antitoxin module
MSRTVRFLLMLALAGSNASFCNRLYAQTDEIEESVEQADDQPTGQSSDYYDEQLGSTPAAQPLEAQPLEARPLDDDPAPEPQPLEKPTEKFAERYPSGKIKIEREVTQDGQGNYVNHGSWTLRNERGQVISEGRFVHGERHGTWNRWHQPKEAAIFAKPPYSQFQGPYISQADFDNGKLDGNWTIYDSKQRKISQIGFSKGQRHGTATWWFANGKRMRQITYRDGLIDGELEEWTADGKLTVRQVYQEGRRLALKTAYYPGAKKIKKSEGMYLHAREVVKTNDDWWNATMATYVHEGVDDKHGPWTSWYGNGQKQVEGQYAHNLPTGNFTWWHANNQIASEGTYEEGKQHGRWVWWHENGQKSIQGECTQGSPSGRWSWWDEGGELAKSADLSGEDGDVARMEMENDAALKPTFLDPKQR